MRYFALLSLLMLPLLFTLQGCGGPTEANAAEASVPRPLSFTVSNRSGGPVKSIGLSGANMPMAFRNLANGESATLSNKALKLPKSVSLHWSDAQGNRMEAAAEVWGELSPTYSGPITLKITSSGTVKLSGG